MPALGRQSGLVHSVRDAQRLAVVRDRDVVMTERAGRRDQGLHTRGAVGLVGVHLQVALESGPPIGVARNDLACLRVAEEPVPQRRTLAHAGPLAQPGREEARGEGAHRAELGEGSVGVAQAAGLLRPHEGSPRRAP